MTKKQWPDSHLKQDDNASYVLVINGCWITVGEIDVHICEHNNTVEIAVYPPAADGDVSKIAHMVVPFPEEVASCHT